MTSTASNRTNGTAPPSPKDSTMSEREDELHEAVGALRHYATTPRCDSNMMGAIDMVCRAALRATPSWQTMESAPKDGTPVDLWCVAPDDLDPQPDCRGVRLTDCFWHNADSIFPHTGWCRVIDDGNYDLVDGPPTAPFGLPRWVPVAWHPLPTPPAEPEDGK
jgi:hypothetical protein